MPPASIDRGHIVLLLSVCLSAENLTCELNIFLLLQYCSSYNAQIQYAGSFRQYPTSGGSNHQGQGRISRLHFSKNGHFGGISVSQTRLVQVLNFIFWPANNILTNHEIRDCHI